MRTILIIFIVIVFSNTFVKANFNLVLLHNNDIHGRFEETTRNSGTCRDPTPTNGVLQHAKGCVGGFARTAHVIRKFRREAAEGRGSPVLFLNAGDTYVGTAWFALHKWRISAEFLNALKPDAVCLGNHEFDFGVPVLAPFVQKATFPIIGGNLNFDKEPSLHKIKNSVILDVEGKKIGIVGHLTPDTKIMSSPGQVEFLDIIQSVKNETEVLKRKGVEIIIILGHSGYEMDLKVASEVPLADVVIGGHTNTFLWNGKPPDSDKPEDVYPKVVVQRGGKKVPVVQAFAYTKYLGVLNVTFDDHGDLIDFQGQPIFLDTNVPQDLDILALLDKYRPEIDAVDAEVVGSSRVLLDATSNKCRHMECNLGNLIADSFVFYIASHYTGPGWTDTPIGLINGGSVRTTIDPLSRGGNITKGELMGTLPFENQVVSLQLTGAQIIQTLEIGVRSNGETSKGEFLQVSGLKVVYNMSQPSFSRVVSVLVRCGNCSVPIYRPIQKDRKYSLVTVSFLTGGGDDHHFLRDAENKKVQDLGDVDTVVWYLQRQLPVFPEEQGRIQFLENRETSSTATRFLRPTTFLLITVIRYILNV